MLFWINHGKEFATVIYYEVLRYLLYTSNSYHRFIIKVLI
jgi:hypothetical protein